MQKGEFPHAYRCAQDACYLAFRRWSLVEAADYTEFQMIGNLHYRNAVQALIDMGLGFRTLSRVLSQNGYDRTAGLVAIAAVGLVEGSGQPGITSMVYEAFGHVALKAGLAAEASACADRAAAEAAEFRVTEHILNAQLLQLSIQARNRETASLSSDLSELAANAAQKGFGMVARDCINLGTELGVAPPWMLQAAHGRYREQAVPTRGRSDSLLYELRALRPLHPLGRWLEFKLLRWLDSYRNELPDFVWTFSEQQLGSWAACSSSLDDDIGAGEHDGVLRILDEDESDEDMLDIMAGAFFEGGVEAFEGGIEAVYRRARAGVYHVPSSHRLRGCLLSWAKRNGLLDDAVGVLLDIAARQVEVPSISRDVANALREAGNYQVAALVADAGHRAGNIMMSGGGPEITTIIGFGLDLVQLGLDPAGIQSAVEDGFKGKPLVHRYGDRSQDALSRSLKFVGGRKGDVGDRFVTMSAVMDQMYEQQMAAAALAIEDGSAPQLAIAAFAHYLRQPHQLIDSAGLDAVGACISALEMIRGHDEAVMAMTTYLLTYGH
jgi:hypothetical protein